LASFCQNRNDYYFSLQYELLQSSGSNLTLGARSDDLVGIFKGLWLPLVSSMKPFFIGRPRTAGHLEELEPTHSVRLQAVGPPDALYRMTLIPTGSAMAAPVVAFWDGPAKVEATTRSAPSEANGGMREGRSCRATGRARLPGSVGGAQFDLGFLAHSPDSHDRVPRGIPKRLEILDLAH
jgi:hypothetical protein